MPNSLPDSHDYRTRFGGLRYLPIGDVLLYLDNRIAYCRANRKRADEEYLEEFYIESEASYRWFKARIKELVADLASQG